MKLSQMSIFSRRFRPAQLSVEALRKTESHEQSKPGRTGSVRTLRGVSLVEALFAVMLGGVAITQGMDGLSTYSEGLKVQATASKISMLDRAAERFSKDNYSSLVDAAPAEYDIDVLEPYVAGGLGPDAFGNEYKISTRVYTVKVVDPVTGGQKDQDVLQTLVFGSLPNNSPSELKDNLLLRAKVVNSLGVRAGFISDDELQCTMPNGKKSKDGAICGSYGSYAIESKDFAASNFNRATLVSMVTTGDSASETDLLYRYSYGDEELNTMRTDLLMDGNKIEGVSGLEFTGAAAKLSSESGALTVDSDLNLGFHDINQVDTLTTRGITLSGGTQNITSNSGNINISSGVNILAKAENIAQLDLGRNGGATSNRLELVQRDSRYPVINGSAGALQIGLGKNYLQVGETDNFVSPKGNVAVMGSGGIGASLLQSRAVLTNEIRSVFTNSGEELALQNVNNGTVTIGKKEVGTVVASDGTEFEISNGRLIVGEIQARNILCSECSGGDAFTEHNWYSANGMGLHPYEGRSGYRNNSGQPIQVSAWSKIKSSSGGWFMYVRQMGVAGAGWIEVHADTSEGGSGNTVIVPPSWEAMVVGARAVNLLLPKSAKIVRQNTGDYNPGWSIVP